MLRYCAAMKLEGSLPLHRVCIFNEMSFTSYMRFRRAPMSVILNGVEFLTSFN